VYDIIGDIHGHADKLIQLLEKLGYKYKQRIWRHSNRKVIFLGDFVDRGPQQIETVDIAKGMVEHGHALAVMGNHEYNAVAWTTEDPDNNGEYLRPHNAKNQQQHQTFLDQVVSGSERHHAIVDWFKTLPVFLDLPACRIIHACWHNHYLNMIKPYLDTENRLLSASWVPTSREGSEPYDAIETLLKGMEVNLPTGHSFHDKDGHKRTRVRIKWWQTDATSYQEMALLPPQNLEKIPDIPIENEIPKYDQLKPVFIGHYWLKDKPAPLADKVACLDYSVVDKKEGKLCAYRFDGETNLTPDGFVYV